MAEMTGADPVWEALLRAMDSPEFHRMMEQACRQVCREEMDKQRDGGE